MEEAAGCWQRMELELEGIFKKKSACGLRSRLQAGVVGGGLGYSSARVRRWRTPAGLWKRAQVEVSGCSYCIVKNIQVEVTLDFPDRG